MTDFVSTSATPSADDFTAICKEFALSVVTSIPTSATADPQLWIRLIEQLARQFGRFAEAIFGRLDGIDEKLKKMLDADFKAGIDRLQLAINAENEGDRKLYIAQARDKFSDAVGQVDERLVPVAHFYKGTCLDILGDKRNAVRSYFSAFDEAWAYEVKCIKEKPFIERFYGNDSFDRARDYNDKFLLPLSRLIIRRSSELVLDDDGKRRLRCAHLIDLLQYPWEAKAPLPTSKLHEPWDIVITLPQISA
jgi:hypothetical protein